MFSGSAHPELAAEICAHLGVPLQPGAGQPVRQRLPRGAAPGQLPRAGRLPGPAAGPAGAGAPGRAAADAGRGPGRVGGPDHRGDAALRLRPLGQEGRAAHLDRRAAGGRPAGGRGRQPGAGDDPALAAGPRVLRRARSTTCTRCASWPTTSGGSTCRNTTVVSPDLGNAKEASAFARLLGAPVAAGAKQRFADDRVSDQRGHRRRRRPGRHRAGRRDRQGQHGHRTARPAARAERRVRSGSPAPTGCSPTARWSGSPTSRTCRRSSAPTPCRSRRRSGTES